MQAIEVSGTRDSNGLHEVSTKIFLEAGSATTYIQDSVGLFGPILKYLAAVGKQ